MFTYIHTYMHYVHTYFCVKNFLYAYGHTHTHAHGHTYMFPNLRPEPHLEGRVNSLNPKQPRDPSPQVFSHRLCLCPKLENTETLHPSSLNPEPQIAYLF